MKAQTRRLKKSKLLFNKVGKSKQIRKMAVTPVLTMLTSPFWSHFASLDCPHQISKNPRVIISFIEKLKNAPFTSYIQFFYTQTIETNDTLFIRRSIVTKSKEIFALFC